MATLEIISHGEWLVRLQATPDEIDSILVTTARTIETSAADHGMTRDAFLSDIASHATHAEFDRLSPEDRVRRGKILVWLSLFAPIQDGMVHDIMRQFDADVVIDLDHARAEWVRYEVEVTPWPSVKN